jgi:hypothetical protein
MGKSIKRKKCHYRPNPYQYPPPNSFGSLCKKEAIRGDVRYLLKIIKTVLNVT